MKIKPLWWIGIALVVAYGMWAVLDVGRPSNQSFFDYIFTGQIFKAFGHRQPARVGPRLDGGR